MHTMLERQLKKAFGNIESVPQSLYPFLQAVSNSYEAADEDRRLIERSLEISSQELGDLNKRIREESNVLKDKVRELERLNRIMIDRELKMVELKKEIAFLRSALNPTQKDAPAPH